MVRPGTSLLILLAALSARAATRTAASARRAAVLAEVSLAQPGDTVLVPSTASEPGGWVQWDNALDLNKAITLQGAGMDSTWIVASNGCPALFRLYTTSSNRVTHLTGFKIDGGTRAQGVLIGNNIAKSWGLFRVSSNRIFHCTGGTLYALNVQDPFVSGVVDHCVFQNNYLHFGAQSVGPYTGGEWKMDASWRYPVTVGTTNTTVFEDCVFLKGGTPWTDPFNGSFENGQGGRYCMRYCYWTNLTSASDQPIIDSHGNQGPVTTANSMVAQGGVRGTRQTEIYNNVFQANPASGVKFYYRGGIALVFSNQCYGSGFDSGWKLDEEDGPARYNSLASYPGYDMHMGFIWSNYVNGVHQASWYNGLPGMYAADALFISDSAASGRQNIFYEPPSVTAVADPDYFMAARGFSGGRVTPAFTSYTPLVYPHPLVSGPPVTSEPVLQVTQSEINFGPQFTNTFSTNTFNVTNIGTGTLTGAATVSAPFHITNGAYSLATGAGTNIGIYYNPTTAAFSTQAVSFSGAGSVSVNVRGVSIIENAGFGPWYVTNATYSFPWVLRAPYPPSATTPALYQSSYSQSVAQGGVAIWGFKIDSVATGEMTLTVSALVTNTFKDSLGYVGVDAYPAGDADIFDVNFHSATFVGGQTIRRAASSTYQVAAGRHYVVIVGRDPWCALANLSYSVVGQ